MCSVLLNNNSVSLVELHVTMVQFYRYKLSLHLPKYIFSYVVSITVSVQVSVT